MISKHILNLKVEYKSSIVHNHDSLGEMISLSDFWSIELSTFIDSMQGFLSHLLVYKMDLPNNNP